MKHSNFFNEVDQTHDEDKWWKFTANLLLFIVVAFSIAQAVRYFIFIA